MRTWALAVCSVWVASTALADTNKDTAERLFNQGRDLLAQKKYAEACAAFEQSQRLDPEFGTEFNLAACDVEIGKLAAAWNLYHELARSDSKPARRQASSDLAEKLDARVPRLVVEMNDKPNGLAVTIDGADSTSLVGVEVRVDLGEHVVVATAPGMREERKTVKTGHEGETRTVTIHLVPATSAPAPEKPTPIVETSSSRATYGKVAVIGGSVIAAAGLAIGAYAISTWHDAQDCTACDRTSTAHSAVIAGDISTVMVIAGVVPVIAGVYLWKTAGSSATIAPHASSDSAGLSVVGRF